MFLTDVLSTGLIIGAPVLLLYLYLNFRHKKYQILERLLENDSDHATEIIKLMQRPQYNGPLREKKIGLFLCAVGVGMFLVLAPGQFGYPRETAFFGLLPFCIGISFFVMSRLSGKIEKD